ncbi:MAG: hypothetical protein QXT33_06375 [Thermofilum sp.]
MVAEVKREVYRKAVHLLLSLILMAPFFLPLPAPLDIYSYYALGLLAAALLSSTAAKRSVFLSRLSSFRESLEQRISGIRELQKKMPLKAIEEAFIGLVEFIGQQVELLERDYERREGYVGLFYGMTGGVISLLLSPCHALYGLAALAVVDPAASLSNLLLRRGKSFTGDLVAFGMYFAVLLSLGVPAVKCLLLSLAAVVAEYFSVEDNLTIPPVVTLAALLLGAPPFCPVSSR